MSELLEALFDGSRMGQLIYNEKKDSVSFFYDKNWLENPAAFPLSLSMPLVKPEHSDPAVRAFISGLLPDNDAVLNQWGRDYQVSPRNPFRLLRHVGEECAGAVQFVRPDRAPDWLAGNPPQGIDWLDEAELADRMRELLVNHAAARRRGDRGQFSLAGAQPKIGLFRDATSGHWGIPMGATPTTHILKPNVGSFKDYDQNEQFCLSLARRVGLPTAHSWIERIGDIPVIIVERFDRAIVDGEIVRVHQEDSCQALGRMPGSKYQKDGGPSAGEIFKLIREYSSKPREDELRFLDAMIFNWLIMGTDAHAKNYSFLIAGNAQVRLARLYDLSSFYPYQRKNEERKTKLAMKIGGEYRHYRIAERKWEKASSEWKIDRGIVFGRIVFQAKKIAEAAKNVAAEMADSEMLDCLVGDIVKNASTVHKLFTVS